MTAAIQASDKQQWVSAQADLNFGEQAAWLSKLRKDSLAQFEKQGLPQARDEDWRHTNLEGLKAHQFDTAAVSATELPALPEQIENSLRLVFVNGVFNAALSSGQNTAEGFTILPLALALSQTPDILQANLGKTTPQNAHGFTLLNTAYSQDGYVLQVGKNVNVEQTIEAVFINTGVNTDGAASASENDAQAMSHVRNIIVAETSSQCKVIERFIGTNNAVYLNNCVTEIIAGDNTQVDHYKVIEESDNAYHCGGVFVNQARDTNVSTHNVCLTGGLTRNDVFANLFGQGGHCEMNGLVLGRGQQHIDNHTEVNHAVPNCTSDELYKTVLDDQSRSIFRGRIIVAEDAQQTKADQQNNNLLLSNRAEADSKPQLEIYADDVQCSHGATVGQLDTKSLFYMRSRGIDLTSAQRLLTFAFAGEVIERIKIDSLSEQLRHYLAGQLLED